jgi:PIN domain nuclease of toxin-antitoxin system
VIVLDTHAWVWWVADPRRLSRSARAAIERAVQQRELYVSCISVWEVAMLVSRGRLRLRMEVGDWIAAAEALPFLRFVPVDTRIALRSVQLREPFHPDPADRMIVATALTLGARLVSKDERMHTYPHVDTVW